MKMVAAIFMGLGFAAATPFFLVVEWITGRPVPIPAFLDLLDELKYWE